jgi:hypothetical protein
MNTLEISAYSIRKETTEKRMKAAVFGLAAGIVLSAVLYGVFLVETVVHTTYRQNTQRTISTLRTEVGDKETERVALKQGITVELAKSLGYVEMGNPQYLARSNSNKVSLNSR